MKHMTLPKILSLIGLMIVFSLSGCSNTPNKRGGDYDSGAAESTEAGAGADETSQTAGGERQGGVQVIGATGDAVGEGLDADSLDGSGTSQSQDADAGYQPEIYFGYDQYDVDDKGVDIAKHYAQILVNNPQKSVRLVGNTDERGTPEYNLALGERRANSVAEIMMLYGVSKNKIDVVSLGEEQPLVDGSNESAWAKNRRVDIIIK